MEKYIFRGFFSRLCPSAEQPQMAEEIKDGGQTYWTAAAAWIWISAWTLHDWIYSVQAAEPNPARNKALNKPRIKLAVSASWGSDDKRVKQHLRQTLSWQEVHSSHWHKQVCQLISHINKMKKHKQKPTKWKKIMVGSKEKPSQILQRGRIKEQKNKLLMVLKLWVNKFAFELNELNLKCSF